MIRRRTAAVATALLFAAGARPACAQIAQGASKHLGNIASGGNIPTGFGTYWNEIATDYEGRWASVEGRRDSMDWAALDRIDAYAKINGIPWTLQPLVWGSTGYPGWMNLPVDTLKVEMEEWFTLAGARYPEVATVVVVEEGIRGHAYPSIFASALGGAGSSGYDWMIEAFRMARAAFPRAKLILDDYNTIETATDNAAFLKSVRALLAADAPIDGIGTQAHEAYKLPVDTLRKYLDSLSSTGLPVYITQYDIATTDDAKQDSIMQAQFPLFWNHPRVAGITLWGYISGRTWRTGSGLRSQEGVERPALAWLKSYVASHPNPPTPIRNTTGSARTGLPWTDHVGRLEIRNLDGRMRVGIQRGQVFVPMNASRTN